MEEAAASAAFDDTGLHLTVSERKPTPEGVGEDQQRITRSNRSIQET